MTRSFYRPAFQGAFETVRINKLNVNQRPGIVIQRDNHITGAERHAAGFVYGRQHDTLMTGESLAGEVGVAAGRSGFLHELYGQRGRRFAVSLRFCFCGRNHFQGNRRQVAGHGIHLSGGLGGRHAKYLLNQLKPVTRAALVAEPRPASSLSSKRKRSEPPHTGQA